MNGPAKMKQESIQNRIANKFGVDETQVFSILKQTAFKVKGNDATQATDAQMVALMIVCDQYGLNPFTKEIYAYPDKGNGIVPVVSVDGWARIINEHPQMNGIEFRYSEKMTTPAGGKTCHDYCDVVFYRKDRAQPIVVREYLDEVYVPVRGGYAGPWQSHTKRMLRHKTLIQGARIAFGFGGIYDEDEASRIVEKVVHEVEDDSVQNLMPKAAQVLVEKSASEKPADQPVKQSAAIKAASYSKANDASAATEAGNAQDVSPIASESLIVVVKSKLDRAGLTMIDIKEKFGIDALEGVTTSMANAIIKWAVNPGGQ